MSKESRAHIDKNILLEEIIENIPYHIFWKDSNLTFQGCNTRFAKQFGYENPEKLKGKHDEDFPWPATLREKYNKDDCQVINSITPILNTEEEQIQTDGSSRYLLVSKVPLKLSDGTIGVLGIYNDITDRKKMELELLASKEKAEIATKAKSEFIANMSHDIRTPITGMLGMTQTILSAAKKTQAATKEDALKLLKVLAKTVQEDGSLLLNATSELLQLCNEILEIINIESGEIKEKKETFDLRKLVRRNVDLLKPVAQHKNLSLICEIDDSVPQFLTEGFVYIDRILLNLIGNALKFTRAGSVNLTLSSPRTQTTSNDTVALEIKIKDTGIGIPKDKFEFIFENFSRISPAYQGIYKGTGLGLYLVKQYVEKMNGTIKVESEEKVGTCFTVTLPFLSTVPSQKLEKPPSSHLTQETINLIKEANLNILIVEDNPIASKIAQLLLNELNCKSELAHTGAKAIKMAKFNSYDLILMDIGLPDCSGIETAQKIKKLSNCQSTPIIALTGHLNDTQMYQKSLKAGMKTVLTKPIDTSTLGFALVKYALSLQSK